MNALILLKQDHGNVEALFARFEQLDPDAGPDERRAIVDKVIEHLSVHAAIEEQLFYPTLRSTVPGTDFLALEGLEEHLIVKWTLKALEDMNPTDERFAAKMKVLIENVRHHVREEEDEVFPRVRDAMSAAQLDELGERMEAAKATAPTRPHPMAPDTPPANLVTGPAAALVDKARQTGKDVVDNVVERITGSH